MKNTKIVMKKWLENEKFYGEHILNNERQLIEEGNKKALEIFQAASQKIPAYKAFLKKNKITPEKVKTIKDFAKIPITTKENYITKYALKDRCWNGNLGNMHHISTSSGTTGESHFWPRDLETEIEGAYIHELILRYFFHVNKKNTLFINGFAMGTWIAGTYTLACIHLVSWKDYPITLMSPGYNAEAVIALLKSIAQEFEQIIISGHTPFLKELIDIAIQEKIDLKKLNIKLLGTGQAITERWRKYIIKKLGSKDYYHTFYNLYGSADASLMGFETPLSIFLRKIIADNNKTRQIFGGSRIPSICNYDPRLIYFESINDELIITKNSGCPLIRYNIHDEGQIMKYSDLINYFNKNELEGLNKVKTSQLPFVYLYGREKFMVKIYGANVYSEHVQYALNHQDLQEHLTGRYVLEMEYDENQNPLMVCRVELNRGISHSEDFIKKVEKIFVEEVKKINKEYEYILNQFGKQAHPKIVAHEYGHKHHFSKEKIKKTA